jgi:hypothetical protein
LEIVFDVDVGLLDDLLLSFDVDVGFTDVVAFELDLFVADDFNEVFELVWLVVLTDDKVLSELFELNLLVVDIFNEVFELVLLVVELVLVLVATGAVKSHLSITNNSLL